MAPTTIAPLPYARFFERCRYGSPIRSDALVEPNVRDHGRIPDHAHARRTHRRLMVSPETAELEVKLVKRKALYQLTLSLGLKRGQGGIAQFLVIGPVAVRDAVQQALVQL